jgi:hypothetical protein
MMFLDCPAYLDEDGTARCGLPAEVRCRFIMRSTDGPLEAAMIRCPAGHWFNGPIEFLTWESRDEHEPGHAGTASGAGYDSHADGHAGLDGSGGFAVRNFPGEPGRARSRPNGAPAYYLGRPARLWISVTGPSRRPGPRRGSADARQLGPRPSTGQFAGGKAVVNVVRS